MTRSKRGKSRTVQDAAQPVFGYVRVSTDKQDLSPDVQAERIRAWATSRGRTITRIYTETQSGKTADDRPVLQEAFKAVCESGGVLVVVKLDRLARNVEDACKLVKRLNEAGADLASLSEGDIDTTTSNGKLIFTIFCALAEWERGQISDRTRAVLDAKRSRGEALGNTPFGQDRGVDGKLVPNPSEMAALRFCLESWAQERSYAKVVRALEKAGHRPRAMPWTAQSVRRVLLRTSWPDADQRARRDAIVEVLEASKLASDRAGLIAAAKILNERGVSPPPTQWSCAQVRRLVAEYFRPGDADEVQKSVAKTADPATLK